MQQPRLVGMKGNAVRGAVLTLTMLASAGPAMAQSPGAKRAGVLEAAVACRAITGDRERLACYDRAVAALDKAEAADEVVVLDKSQVQETRRSLFGLSLPKIRIFGGEKRGDTQLQTLDAVVASTTRDQDGRLIFTIADGARWHQIDDRPSSRVKRGTKVQFRRAAFGSYFAGFEGTTSIRVKREN